MNYSVSLKKNAQTLEEILTVIVQIASEENDSVNPYDDTPPTLALTTAWSYAIHMKNKAVYPIFNKLIQLAL